MTRPKTKSDPDADAAVRLADRETASQLAKTPVVLRDAIRQRDRGRLERYFQGPLMRFILPETWLPAVRSRAITACRVSAFREGAYVTPNAHLAAWFIFEDATRHVLQVADPTYFAALVKRPEIPRLGLPNVDAGRVLRARARLVAELESVIPTAEVVLCEVEVEYCRLIDRLGYLHDDLRERFDPLEGEILKTLAESWPVRMTRTRIGQVIGKRRNTVKPHVDSLINRGHIEPHPKDPDGPVTISDRARAIFGSHWQRIR